MLENWALSLSDLGLSSHFMVFAQDNLTEEFCKLLWPKQVRAAIMKVMLLWTMMYLVCFSSNYLKAFGVHHRRWSIVAVEFACYECHVIMAHTRCTSSLFHSFRALRSVMVQEELVVHRPWKGLSLVKGP